MTYSSNVIHSTTRIEIYNSRQGGEDGISSNVIHSTTRIEIKLTQSCIAVEIIFECNPLNNKDWNRRNKINEGGRKRFECNPLNNKDWNFTSNGRLFSSDASNVIHSTTRIEINKKVYIYNMDKSSNVIHSTTRIEIFPFRLTPFCQPTSNVIHSTTRIEILYKYGGLENPIIFECNPLNNKDWNENITFTNIQVMNFECNPLNNKDWNRETKQDISTSALLRM